MSLLKGTLSPLPTQLALAFRFLEGGALDDEIRAWYCETSGSKEELRAEERLDAKLSELLGETFVVGGYRSAFGHEREFWNHVARRLHVIKARMSP